MKRTTRNILEEYKGKASGYVSLYSYRLVNLCVKADPMSLLGVTVETDDTTVNIEDVAQVAAGDDEFSLKVFPFDETMILMIGKGIADEHVEFKQEMECVTNDNGDEVRYIKLTMPEVNKDRYESMNKIVKTLHDDCKAKLDLCKTVYSAKVTADQIGAKEEDVNEAKKEMENIIQIHDKACEDITTQKNQEIEEAYAAFQSDEQKRQQEKAEQDAAAGQDKTTTYKIN